MIQVTNVSLYSRHYASGACSVRRSAAIQKKIAVPPHIHPFTATNVELQAARLVPSKRSCNCKSVLSPIFGIMFNPILIGIIWAIGATKFWNNYSKTTYTSDKKALLTALWPALYVANATYRSQFKNAVKGD